MDVIGTKVFRVFRVAIHYSTYDFTPPPPPESVLKLICDVNIVYRNPKSEHSQDYVQKPQRNYVHEFGFSQGLAVKQCLVTGQAGDFIHSTIN